MTWAKFEAQMPDHPKVKGLSDRAFRAWVESVCYCVEYLTDGDLPAAVSKRWRKAARAELVAAGLWEAVDDALVAYRIHDFLHFQPERRRVQAERAGAAERMAKLRGSFGRTSTVTGGPRSPEVRGMFDHPDTDTDTEELTSLRRGAGAKENGRPPDHVFEAIVEASGWDLAHLTAGARGRVNRAAKELRDHYAEGTPERERLPAAIAGFAIQWRDHYPGADLTPQAITGNWAAFMAGKLAEGPMRRGSR